DRAGLGRRGPRRDRRRAADGAPRGVDDRSQGILARPRQRVADQVLRRRHHDAGDRPRDPAARRARDHQRHDPRALLRARARRADLRWPRRSPQDVGLEAHSREVLVTITEDIPQQIRPGEELEVAKLTAYLERQFGPGEVAVSQFPGGHSNLTYLVRHGDQEFVLRRPPFGRKVKSAHDMGREYTVLSKLSAVYPRAPRPFAYEPTGEVLGAPFYLMERRRGVILRKDLP